MKRLVRRIINWAYGEDLVAHLRFIEMRQHNLSIMFYDTVLTKAYLDAGLKPGDAVHCEEIKTWPNTPGDDEDEIEKSIRRFRPKEYFTEWYNRITKKTL